MSAREQAILAIDLGTSEAKAGLITREGRLIGSARAGYPLEVDATAGRAEQDPDEWWRAIGQVTHDLADRGLADVAAVCCVGQGPTMVPVDDSGRANHAAITWMDTRSAADAAPLEAATGLTGWGLGILPAARWLEREVPAAAEQTHWYLNAWEWAAFRMTGVAAASRSFGQLLPDPSEAATAGLAADRLAPVVDAGSVVGRLTAEAATQLGLAVGTPVVAGTVDSFASFHGAGLIDAGGAVDTGGTSGGLAVYWHEAIRAEGVWVAAAPLPGRWLLGGAMTATGKALDWLAEAMVGGAPVGELSLQGPEALIVEAAAVPAGADGLVFLPYLAGERSPIWEPQARGAFVGLTLAHGRAHLARAVLEAAAFALRHVATPIVDAGVTIRELRVTGGTARTDTWNQIKADVLVLPVAVPEIRESSLLGAAILAATGIGWRPDVPSGIREMVRIDHRLEPNPANRAAYDAAFEAYVALWPAIAPIVHRMRRVPVPA